MNIKPLTGSLENYLNVIGGLTAPVTASTVDLDFAIYL